MGALFGTEPLGDGPALERVVLRMKVLSVVCWRGYQEFLSAREEQTFEVDEQGLLSIPKWIFNEQAELEPWEIQCLNTPLGAMPQSMVTQATWQCEGIAVLLWAVGLRERPSYDSPVFPMRILETVEQSDYSKVRLPDPDELRDFAENLYSWWRRLRWFAAEQEHVDFVNFAGHTGLQIEQLPLAKNDLAIGKLPIAEDRDIVFGDDFPAVATQRLRAAKWLSGLGGSIYSEVEV